MTTSFPVAKSFIFSLVLSIISVGVMPVTPALAALPAGFEVETLATNMTLPTSITFAPDGRVFIAQKDGTVLVYKNGALLPAPLMKLTDVNTYGDRGLIGIAVDPQFATNGYLYLLYTYENTPGANFSGVKTGRLARVTVVGDTASEASKVVILGSIGGNAATPSCENYLTTADCIPSDSPSHSVGGLRFGPDGKLYVSLGDGAHYDYVDTRALRAQNIDVLAGKILRINTDGTAPADNPFYNGDPTANRSKVYAYGFRNSFRFNFRPSTGALYAGDVGWNTWEEVNKIVPGGNYGWPCREGFAATSGYNCTASSTTTDPLYAYPHDSNGAGSITGGAFSSGTAYPAEYANMMIFGDYAQNWMRRLEVNGSDQFVAVTNFMDGSDGTDGPVELLTGPDGNIYFLSIYTGSLKRLTYTLGNRQPIARISAAPTSGLSPLTVNFSAASSSDPDGDPLTYQWSFGDGGTSTSSAPIHTYATDGTYTAVVTVFDGQGGQSTASAIIHAGNRAPTGSITAPAAGYLYYPNTMITVSGQGTDPEDGALPASAMSWRVILHHNIHIHVLETHNGVASFQMTAPDHGDPDVYTEIELTVTDSGGVTHKTSINIYLNNGAPLGGNLVVNPSLETIDPLIPSRPDRWSTDRWGVNDVTFTYPVPGFEGDNQRGAKVAVTYYESGDAKWKFDPAYVTENTEYLFSNYYMANAMTQLVAQVGYANGTYQYFDMGVQPPSPTWRKAESRFTTPTGARTLGVFHTIYVVGELTVDTYSLTQVGSSTPDTTPPTASITAPANGATVSGSITVTATAADNIGVAGVRLHVDGSPVLTEDTTAPYEFVLDTTTLTNGSHTLTVVARDAAGNTVTSAGVGVTVSNPVIVPGNLIVNPSVETSDPNTSPEMPLGWRTSRTGVNSTVFTYPAGGNDGLRGVRMVMSNRSSGNASWRFANVPVSPSKTYEYQGWYQTNVQTSLIALFTLSSGGTQSVTVATLPASVPTNVWRKATYQITPPANAVSVTIFHQLSRNGSWSGDAFVLRETDSVRPTVLITAPANGATVSGLITVTANATDNTGVAGVQFYRNGVALGAEDTTAPYSVDFDTTTIANSTTTFTALARDSYGNTATSSPVTVTVNNGSSDTTPPTASITAPANGATVSGSITVTATAADNIGVAGVRLHVDGSPVLTEDTTAPYEFVLDTTTLTNGSHTLTVVARDAAGNTVTSAGVGVTVSNDKPVPDANLVLNPSFEETTAAGAPKYWQSNYWGTMAASFAYPVAGRASTSGASITVTSYTNGDAKWYFDDVAVTGGAKYRFEDYSFSTIGTAVIARFTTASGAVSYVEFGAVPASASWQKFSHEFTVPSSAVSMTVFHVIAGVGTLTVDDYSLAAVSATAPANLVLNPSFLQQDIAGQPVGWRRGQWGTHNAAFSYPVPGQTDAAAASVAITSYTDGDAKWYFDDVAVTGGRSYRIRHSYQSTAGTNVVVRYTRADASVSYAFIDSVPVSASWQAFDRTIAVPADAVSLTVFHVLSSVGTLTIDDASVTLIP